MSTYIEKLVNDKVTQIKADKNTYHLGSVTKIEGFVLEVKGMSDVAFYEQVEIGHKAIGYVSAIHSNFVIVSLVKVYGSIVIGDEVKPSGKPFMAKFSPQSIGHVFDIFGEEKIQGAFFDDAVDITIENANTPIMSRGSVERPFLTGIAGIDLIYPIGKGQRQLIIGDKKTGKTQILLDTIVNQKDKDVLCIYIAIGKTKKEIKEIYFELVKRNAMPYTMILTASNDETAPVLSLTPYAGLAIAEQYMLQGRDVFVAIDDLKRHADAYREMSLLMGKVPGRDAYPPDIFYTHSRLLEKGCQYIDGGSITILPVMETKAGDITDYISTNVISITDGQLVLSRKNFERGQKPAINYGLSVSRLGGAVQENDMKKLGAKVRRSLLSYLETRDVYELANVDELSPELKQSLHDGKALLQNFNQYKFEAITPEEILERFQIRK